MSGAREAILDRLRAANGGATSLPMAQNAWESVPRSYKANTAKTRAEVLTLFEERLRDYDATVTHAMEADVQAPLAEVLSAARVSRIGVAAGATQLPRPLGFEFIVDHDLAYADLDQLDAVLTGCAVAIAETGSLVLQSGTIQGRRALTLVPDVHVCIAFTRDVVATVPEAIERLASSANIPTTFVSGPSATADIEMTRVKGVHGPRFLHVLLVHEDAALMSK